MYVGSFWSQPLRYVANRELFEAEQVFTFIFLSNSSFSLQVDLFGDLQGLPRFSTMRKMNDLIKRARSAKVIILARRENKTLTSSKNCFSLIFKIDEIGLKMFA